MDPVTFYYCDTWSPIWFIQVTNIHPSPKSWTFSHCNRTSTFFYLDCDRTSTFALKQNVDVLSHVTGDHLETFWLVLRRVEKMSQWSKSSCRKFSLLLAHAWRHTLAPPRLAAPPPPAGAGEAAGSRPSRPDSHLHHHQCVSLAPLLHASPSLGVDGSRQGVLQELYPCLPCNRVHMPGL
jgi:hypothetical protein